LKGLLSSFKELSKKKEGGVEKGENGKRGRPGEPRQPVKRK
jgi:hypothetical protein